MNWRKIVLNIHLYLGLSAGIFLIILGLTGSVIALEEDINHWLHPDLWYVTPGRRPLPENDLVSSAQNQFGLTRVLAVQFPAAPNLAQAMQMIDGTVVYLNPYDGSVLGSSVGRSNSDLALAYIHQIHLRLVPDPTWAPKLANAGKTVVSVAGVFLCLLVPTGIALWWRAKRTTIHFKATDFKVPWFRLFYDAHQAIGIYVSLFLLIAAVTGILIGFDFGSKMFYSITRSSPSALPQSFPSKPVPGATPIMADQVLEIARRAIPDATVVTMVMPQRAAGSFSVLMRVPQETSRAVHSSVTIDQYTGAILNVRTYRDQPAGYRLIRFNRSIHTGDVFGFPSRILVSLSSLLLVVMVITGMVIWWKKLAH
jgi:uncharacterized iron-regulated membrane protein